MLSPYLLKLLDLLKGDFVNLAVYALLSTIVGRGSAVVSLRKISRLTKIGRPRLIKTLGELKKLGLIDFKTTDMGTELVITDTTLVTYSTTNIKDNTAATSNLSEVVTPITTTVIKITTEATKTPEPVDTVGESNPFLTDSRKFLECGLSVRYANSHSPLQANGVTDILFSPSSSFFESGTGTGTEIGNKQETSIDSPLSGSPEADPEFKGSSTLEKKPRRKKAKKEKPPLTQEELDLGAAWLDYAKRAMSWTKPPKSWTSEKFASELGKICHRKKFKVEWMREVLRFIEKDNFWYQNALSPASLLNKGNNGLQKIDNIIGKMKPNWLKQQERMEAWDRPLSDEELANPFLIQG